MRTCPDCRQQVEDHAAFCDNCGYTLAAGGNMVQPAAVAAPQAAYASAGNPGGGASVICTACGHANNASEVYCDNCGYQLGQNASSGAALHAGASPGPYPGVSSAPAPGMAGPGACSACGFQNLPGETFCAQCGVQLAPVASMPPPPPAYIPPPPPAAQPAYQPPQGGSASGQCSECGFFNTQPGNFCQNCGASLGYVPQPPPAKWVQPPPLQPTPPVAPPPQAMPGGGAGVLSGRLVVTDTGAVLMLSSGKGEAFIGRADPSAGWLPEIDLNPYGGEARGVSRRHARLIAQGGQILIEDLNSTNFTLVNKQRVQANQRCPLKNGDEIRLGRVVLIYYS